MLDEIGPALTIGRQLSLNNAEPGSFRVEVFALAGFGTVGNDAFHVPLGGIKEEADEGLFVVRITASVGFDQDAEPLGSMEGRGDKCAKKDEAEQKVHVLEGRRKARVYSGHDKGGVLQLFSCFLICMRLYDAHNHLQDERFAGAQEALLSAAMRQGVVCMVVNGSCEEDWPAVLDLAKKHPQVLPSFGYHPWYVRERTEKWKDELLRYLETCPSAIGEIGLDRWIKDYDLPLQEEMFVWQLRLAAERNLPVSIHCLQAWGRMFELLRSEPRPQCGFLLHSYGGPVEMVRSFADLGAYFSFPGYFAHPRKERQRQTFRAVPPERLLIETDAPDQLLPEDLNQNPLAEQGTNKPLNHPANLPSIYQFVAQLLGEPVEALAARVEENFKQLFGTVVQ